MVFHKIIREQYGALVQYESNMVQCESNMESISELVE